MEPEFLFWFAFTIKMVVTALFVTLATVIAERLGPTTGALVATLPVSAGPVYVFLALDHDAGFISASAVASLALNAITAIYVTIYVLLAQRRTMWVSVSLAFAVGSRLLLCSVLYNGALGGRSFLISLSSHFVSLSSSHSPSYRCHQRRDPGTTSWFAPVWWPCWLPRWCY